MRAVNERLQNFALSVGMVLGHLGAEDTMQYLTERDITKEEIEKSYQALIAIAKAFYRDPK